MDSFPPSVLDAQTVSYLIAGLDCVFYPSPTTGFMARMAVFWATTGVCMLLAVLYLWLLYRSTPERPRRRCMWFIRIVERPRGRLIVINPRIAWAGTVLAYGAFELGYTYTFWQTYEETVSQAALIALRGFNAVPLFCAGWVISWAGLTAFLLAVEPERSWLSPLWANWLMVGGGGAIAFMHLGLAAWTTVLNVRVFDRYVDLRGALIALDKSLYGQVPTQADFGPVQDPAQAFAASVDAAHIPPTVQWCLNSLYSITILAVDLGGIALAIRLRRQVKENVERLAFVEYDQASRLTATPDAPRLDVTVQPALSNATSSGAGEPSQQDRGEGELRKPSPESHGSTGDAHGKRKVRLDAETVRYLSRQRERGRASAARAQARKVLALQKATRDLVTTSGIIAFIALTLLGCTIFISYCVATGKVTSGEWVYIEGTAMPPQWIYTVAIAASLVYLLYNALRSQKRITGLETLVQPTDGASHTASPQLLVNFAGASRADPSSVELGSSSSSWAAVEEQEDDGVLEPARLSATKPAVSAASEGQGILVVPRTPASCAPVTLPPLRGVQPDSVAEVVCGTPRRAAGSGSGSGSRARSGSWRSRFCASSARRSVIMVTVETEVTGEEDAGGPVGFDLATALDE